MGAFSRGKARDRRKKRVRKKVLGTPERPRLCVFRSAKHIYAQVIDDANARTLVEASTVSKGMHEKLKEKMGNKQAAAIVGDAIAGRALERGIKEVVFDRNGFLYHGRVKTLADAARAKGLDF
jgi:large subunit ribosomal protein L18